MKGLLIIKTLSDDDLIVFLISGDIDGWNKLYMRYYHYSKALAHSFYLQFKSTGISEDELMSKCLSALEIAILKYNPGRNTFYSYWKIIATNSINDSLKDRKAFNQNKKHTDIIYLSDSLSEVGHSKVEEIVGEIDDLIYDEITEKELLTQIMKDMRNLSKFEKEVLIYLVDGYTTDEITRVLQVDKNNIYHAIMGIRKKVGSEIIKRYFK